MISKNNLQLKNQQATERVPHYGLRKLSVGVASVLLSTTLYLGAARVAHAETTIAQSGQAGYVTRETQTTSQTENSTQTNPTSANTQQQANTSAAQQPAQTTVQAQNAAPAPQQNNALHAELSDGTTLDISRNTIGNTGDASKLSVTVNIANAKRGDHYTLFIPKGEAYSIDNLNDQKLTTSGTTTITETDAGYTIQDLINVSNTAISQVFELTPKNNYGQQAIPMKEIGEMLKQVTLKKTGSNSSETSLNFTQVITPQWQPSFKREYPSDGKLFPNTDYTYNLSIRETNGVQNGISYDSNRINSAVNTDATITIPVPASFVLDTARTNAANSFKDKTAITQPGCKGHAIVIHVPKGGGNQGYEGAPGYRLIGYYDIDQPADDTVVKATDQIKIEQTITRYDGSTYQMVKTLDPWSDTLVGKSTPAEPAAATGQVGYNRTSDVQDLPVQVDPSKALIYFTFGNKAPYSVTNGKITLDIADGLKINKIMTPADASLLPGTTSYGYTATLSDGSTINGTVAAGNDVTTSNGLSIKAIVFTPNLVAAGANENCVITNSTAFMLFGAVDPSVPNGTKLSSTITFEYAVTDAKGTHTATANSTNVQKASAPYTSLAVYTYQSENVAYNYLSVYNSTDTKTVSYAHEPILYYVLPAATSYDSISNLQGNPKVSVETVNGRTVVKVDYTGTNFDFVTSGGANTQVHIKNVPFAVSGDYPYAVYIYSPTTQFNKDATNKDVASIKDFDSAYTDGHVQNTYLVGTGTWKVSAANETGIYNYKNSALEKSASIKNTGDGKMFFYSIVANS